MKLRLELASLLDDVGRLQSQVNELGAAQRRQHEVLAAACDDHAAVEQVESLEESIQALRERHAGLQQQLQRRENADALNLNARQKDISVLRDAANRWTDNCCEIRTQIVTNFGLDTKEVGNAAPLAHAPSLRTARVPTLIYAVALTFAFASPMQTPSLD